MQPSKWTTVTIVAGCLLFGAGRAEAQRIKGGYSSSSMTVSGDVSDPYTSGQRGGFVGGISFLAPIGNRAGLQLEVLFHQQGARDVLRVDDVLRLTYIDVPVLAHVDVFQFDFGRKAIYAIAGPTFGFNVQASYEDEGVSEDITDDIRTVDIGLTAGAGLELRRASIEARYTWGLLNTNSDSDLTLRNRSFAVMAGYRF